MKKVYSGVKSCKMYGGPWWVKPGWSGSERREKRDCLYRHVLNSALRVKKEMGS